MGSHARSLRILVADDNPDITESFAELLKAYGHYACIAHDGQEAVICAESRTPDVALVDIGMPKLNGYQVATRLRKSCPTTLLIAVSGWGSSSDKRKAEAAGFHHHFVKPADLKQLMKIVESARPGPSDTSARDY